MAARTPFTVRLEKADHDTLAAIAELRGTTVAELARELLEDRIPQLLDPDEIERQIEAEKRRLLEAADAIRKRHRMTDA